MLVVVDANLLFGSLTASRPAPEWLSLLELSKGGRNRARSARGGSLGTREPASGGPDQEGRAVSEAWRRPTPGRAETVGLGALEGQLSDVVAETGEGFRQTLSTLSLHRGRIAPMPEVGAAKLVRRSLERQPPFDAEDRGMRDTLIWLTVLELVRAGDDVVLASGDTKAFGDRTLGTALAAEARDAAGRSSSVTLAPSLQLTLDVVVQRTSAAFTAAKAAILDDDEVISTVIAELSAGAGSYIVEGAELLRQGWSEQLAAFRINEVVDWADLVIDRATCDADEGVQATVTLSAIADLDVRLSWPEFHEFEALTSGARVDDVGVGMLDGLEQTLLRRDILIVGDVELSRANPSPSVRVTDVLLPQHPPRSGQLALEMLP